MIFWNRSDNMHYLGGKSKQAAGIVSVIETLSKYRHVVDPFMGGASMTAAFARRHFTVEASDIVAPLVAMWQHALTGWRPDYDDITREQWEAAKKLPDSDPLKAFFGFGCSFGGKWFCSPAIGPNSGCIPTYAMSARSSISRKADTMAIGVTITCRSFFDIAPIAGVVLYCDPPYANTTGYGAAGKFDCNAFWSRCREWVAARSDVFVSEFSAPDDAVCVYEQRRTQTIAMGIDRQSEGATNKVEKLWMLAPGDATIRRLTRQCELYG